MLFVSPYKCYLCELYSSSIGYSGCKLKLHYSLMIECYLSLLTNATCVNYILLSIGYSGCKLKLHYSLIIKCYLSLLTNATCVNYILLSIDSIH